MRVQGGEIGGVEYFEEEGIGSWASGVDIGHNVEPLREVGCFDV